MANDRKKIRRVETEKRQTEKRSLGSGNREAAKRKKGSAGNKNGIRTERQKKMRRVKAGRRIKNLRRLKTADGAGDEIGKRIILL